MFRGVGADPGVFKGSRNPLVAVVSSELVVAIGHAAFSIGAHFLDWRSVCSVSVNTCR